jgi:hypothetical protein
VGLAPTFSPSFVTMTGEGAMAPASKRQPYHPSYQLPDKLLLLQLPWAGKGALALRAEPDRRRRVHLGLAAPFRAAAPAVAHVPGLPSCTDAAAQQQATQRGQRTAIRNARVAVSPITWNKVAGRTLSCGSLLRVLLGRFFREGRSRGVPPFPP